jgi:hypothetical protein
MHGPIGCETLAAEHVQRRHAGLRRPAGVGIGIGVGVGVGEAVRCAIGVGRVGLGRVARGDDVQEWAVRALHEQITERVHWDHCDRTKAQRPRAKSRHTDAAPASVPRVSPASSALHRVRERV